MWCVDVAAIPSPFSLSRSRRIRGVRGARGVRGVERKQSLNLNKALPFIIIISHSSRRHTMTITTLLRCQTPDEHFHSNNNQPPQPQEQSSTEDIGFWGKWMAHSAEMRAKLAKLGLAAVLAYGLFDGVTYTTFFVLAFLGYEKSTGKNPAANLQALLGIVLLMWTGNNVTRPFRVAGAAALAPAIDKVLKSIQEKLNLPRVVYAFALVVGIFASACLSVAGLLILSRWGK